jgi:hypothetical protein
MEKARACIAACHKKAGTFILNAYFENRNNKVIGTK